MKETKSEYSIWPKLLSELGLYIFFIVICTTIANLDIGNQPDPGLGGLINLFGPSIMSVPVLVVYTIVFVFKKRFSWIVLVLGGIWILIESINLSLGNY